MKKAISFRIWPLIYCSPARTGLGTGKNKFYCTFEHYGCRKSDGQIMRLLKDQTKTASTGRRSDRGISHPFPNRTMRSGLPFDIPRNLANCRRLSGTSTGWFRKALRTPMEAACNAKRSCIAYYGWTAQGWHNAPVPASCRIGFSVHPLCDATFFALPSHTPSPRSARGNRGESKRRQQAWLIVKNPFVSSSWI